MLHQYFPILAVIVALSAGDIEVNVDEEVSVGTEVTRLPDHRSIFGSLSTDQIQTMTYAILSQNSPPASYFNIDPKTGIVTVASRMDRENICDHIERCSVKVNIAIQAGGQSHVSFSTVVTLEVVINDVNDNPPRFPPREVSLEIPEGAKIRTELKISGAIDRDSKPEFTVQHYNITPSMTTFSLRATINLDGSSTINLRLEKELDRETTDEYNFNIIAYDGGSNPQSDYLSVTIRVTDDNDNIPKFSKSKYEMVVNTNQKLGATIGQVLATDEDIGEFGRVTYSFSSSSESAIRGMFAINSSSGWISLTGDLKTIRRQSPFLMFVDAKDNGEPPLSSQALVSVLIINSDNNPPSVTVNTIAASDVSSLAVPESAALDHFVAFVDIEDNDDGDNGKVDCHILSGSVFKLSPVPNKGYTLLLSSEVDREKIDSYQIGITCKDGGTPSLETQVTLLINITDVNDNTPKFSTNLYTGTVDENRDVGQFIIQVTAQDADMAVNAEITYSLSNEAQKYIRIHARTGVVSTSSSLDREMNETLRFKVFATDGGEAPRTGVAEISIVVRDINDNNPQFNQSKFVFSVPEQTLNGTSIGILSAYDFDIGPNGQFDFFFGGSTHGEVPLPFTVLRNGSILVMGVLDRETKGFYSFTALVRDRGDVPRSNTVPVEIKILDVNDNDPVILFPTSKNHTILISSFPENGMVLGRIIAYDMDEGESAELRYSIYDGDIEGAFSVGVNNGELIIRNIERLQNHKEYYLLIKVEDISARPRNTTAQIRIEVLFDNTTGPDIVEQNERSREQYIVIVGVIGGATIVISIIIITAIILILRSERNRRDSPNVQTVKNKFFGAAIAQSVPIQKHVDNMDITKSQSSSSLGSDPQGLMLGSGHVMSKKNEDVPKKVSFSLHDDSHDHGQVQLPEKQLHLSLQCSGDGHMPWKKSGNPDDISSDTSGESGTSDSGRGTSEEDIKFDYLLHRGPSCSGEQYLSPRNRPSEQYSFPNPINSRVPPTYQSHGSPRLHTNAPLLRPDPPSSLEINQTRLNVSNTRNSYNGHKQYPLSSFAPEVSSSLRQPHHPRVYNIYKDNNNKRDPNLCTAYKNQDSIVSMDDDVSTTTSGSYVINPEEVRLDGFLNNDIVV